MFDIIPARSDDNQTILDWYRRRERINFDPPYQRISGLWDINARQLFIDSLINGYDVPKFYVHKPFISKGNHLYSIIDGKQRLQCIFDFMDNKFSLSNDFTLDENDSKDIAGKTYDQLAVKFPKVIDRFDKYTLDVVQIITDDEEKIRELFLRLNEGVTLNNSEKRLSKGGFLNDEIVKPVVSNHRFFRMLRFKNSRFSYEEIFTKILLLEYSNTFTSLTKSNLDKFVEANKEQNVEINHIINESKSGLDRMCQVFENTEQLLVQKSIIPIYYLFIKKLWNRNCEEIKNFLLNFEAIKMENRKMNFDRMNPILNEFDRLNQQGANSSTAIRERFIILSQYFNIYERQGFIDIRTVIDSKELELWE